MYGGAHEIHDITERTELCESDTTNPEGTTAKCYSPLLLDMNGDGIRTTSTADPVFFDLDADGVKEWVSWSDAAGEEAFLYRDVNGNHTSDAGDELFGTSTLLDSGEAAPN